MAKTHGKNGVIKAITSTGTPAAVGEVKNFELSTSAALVEASKIGSDYSESLLGLISWEVSLEAHYDPADGPQADLIEGASVDLELVPQGETSGNETFTGTALVTGVTVSVANDIVVSYAVTCTGTGALTRGTVA